MPGSDTYAQFDERISPLWYADIVAPSDAAGKRRTAFDASGASKRLTAPVLRDLLFQYFQIDKIATSIIPVRFSSCFLNVEAY
jgi:hypothetical protein